MALTWKRTIDVPPHMFTSSRAAQGRRGRIAAVIKSLEPNGQAG
jgi:hypothetical protein